MKRIRWIPLLALAAALLGADAAAGRDPGDRPADGRRRVPRTVGGARAEGPRGTRQPDRRDREPPAALHVLRRSGTAADRRADPQPAADPPLPSDPGQRALGELPRDDAARRREGAGALLLEPGDRTAGAQLRVLGRRRADTRDGGRPALFSRARLDPHRDPHLDRRVGERRRRRLAQAVGYAREQSDAGRLARALQPRRPQRRGAGRRESRPPERRR